MPAEDMRIPMTDNLTGDRVTWTVHRAYGWWSFTDHEGYERVGGQMWSELVDRFRGSAANYNLRHTLS